MSDAFSAAEDQVVRVEMSAHAATWLSEHRLGVAEFAPGPIVAADAAYAREVFAALSAATPDGGAPG